MNTKSHDFSKSNIKALELKDNYFHLESISPEELDILLSQGWRHFGTYFFRLESSFLESNNEFLPVKVIPLRIFLPHFQLSKSQRKILRKNEQFSIKRQLVSLNPKKHLLFEKHALRFSEHSRPMSLYNFLSETPDSTPLPTYEIEVWDKEKLVACSFVDITPKAFSSIYAMFDTDYLEHSLGIFTLLKEIEWAKELGKTYLYLGYAYDRNSFYDYKKRFSALEKLQWESFSWVKFQETEVKSEN